jgi:hypothetical protein
MSINSMTNDELRRRNDFRRQAVIQSPVAKDLSMPVPPATTRAATEVAVQDNTVTTAINSLVKYIPTEVVTLYVAALSATPVVRSAIPAFDTRVTYWGFAVITPLLLLLVYASKRSTSGLPALPVLKEWPWWKMFAATAAFLVWALAVPSSPYISGETSVLVAGFGAIIISTFLSLLEPIFERPASKSSTGAG